MQGTTHLKLPVFKSNIPGDKVFSNNTHFISNTKAFYDDLNLIWDNAQLYNQNGSDIYVYAGCITANHPIYANYAVFSDSFYGVGRCFWSGNCPDQTISDSSAEADCDGICFFFPFYPDNCGVVFDFLWTSADFSCFFKNGSIICHDFGTKSEKCGVFIRNFQGRSVVGR